MVDWTPAIDPIQFEGVRFSVQFGELRLTKPMLELETSSTSSIKFVPPPVASSSFAPNCAHSGQMGWRVRAR